MSNNPLISIITVTYNAEETVGLTAASVAEQSFRDFEHIIIDGASRDNTMSVARREGVDSLKIISEPDKGLYDAMNKGITAARGQYLIFLNAGDTFTTENTLSQYAHAAKRGYDIVYGDTQIVDNAGNILGMRHLSAPHLLHKKSLAKGMLVCHQAFMVKKSLAPRYDTGFKFSADYDWMIRSVEKTSPGRCHNLNRITINYLSDGTTDNNKIASLVERFRIMSHHYGLLPTLFNHLGFVGRALKRGSL